MKTDLIWQTKLHARLHDPAEKALVLLRDPDGHEGGSSEVLHRLLGFKRIEVPHLDPDNAKALHTAVFKHGIPKSIYETVRRADWWAAAGDRPQWPMEEIEVRTRQGVQSIKRGAQVRWTQKPILIHPLTGEQFDLKKLANTDLDDLKSSSFTHFSRLIQRTPAGEIDWYRTMLACWRFGPELGKDDDASKLGSLWPMLPADTRVPDHSIWDHLDLTSAFAGAFAADPDGEVALLTLAIGPVQSFIAAARSTSDLWAGSHLLSRLAWEAMKPVCEALGPDAILFPRLRSVPQVDLWLQEMNLPKRLFAECEWTQQATDANPLFAAALPNRFVAIVPRSQARSLAEKVETDVRKWLANLGDEVLQRLLKEAGVPDNKSLPCYQQMREQLAGFPEVHWAAVPFSLIRARDPEKQTDLDTTQLSAAMAPFFGVEAGQPAGFLASPAWQVLQKEVPWESNISFFSPNPGVLYPAIHDLAERALAAAKTSKRFSQIPQEGWRCSLTGETEWLTIDRAHLQIPPGQRENSLWSKIAKKQAAWVRQGEHLGALAAIKRLWPSLFAEKVGQAIGNGGSLRRFVVSTHTMALAHQIDAWLESGAPGNQALTATLQEDIRAHAVALPRRLSRQHAKHPAIDLARRLPGLLDQADTDTESASAEQARHWVRQTLAPNGQGSLETYYGMILMDGDRMGAWLAGDDEYAITYCESFHPQVEGLFQKQAQREALLKDYGDSKRAVSANRHLAISAALNDFSLTVVPHVLEEEFLGRVIYAGGDDVLAMLPVAQLLPAMQRLRRAYAGQSQDGEKREIGSNGLTLSKGFAVLKRRGGLRIMRMMGQKATASCGAVVAHHQAPLSSVLRELRTAEQEAKNRGGRDAFTLRIVKRSGGAVGITAKWGEPARLLTDLRDFLAKEGVSRRAVYHTLEWLKDLPPHDPNMLRAMLSQQMGRQAAPNSVNPGDIDALAERLANLSFNDNLRPPPKDGENRLDWLQHFLSVAEFLARESRCEG